MTPPSELERTVSQWAIKGQAWVEAKLESDLLEKDRESFLASIVNNLRKVLDVSEKQLEAEAKGSQEYRDFIKGMVLAKHKELRARVEYDALEKMFAAKQSDQSLLKAQIEKGIFYQGQ